MSYTSFVVSHLQSDIRMFVGSLETSKVKISRATPGIAAWQMLVVVEYSDQWVGIYVQWSFNRRFRI